MKRNPMFIATAILLLCRVAKVDAFTPTGGRPLHPPTPLPPFQPLHPLRPNLLHPLLLIQGGKSDPTSSYTYSSSPNTDSAFYLTLPTGENNLSLDEGEVGWVELGEEGEGDGEEGDKIAWAVAGYFPGSESVVYFGGDGGPNLPVQTNNDSTWMYTFPTTTTTSSSNSQQGNLTTTITHFSPSAGSQPMRRLYSASSMSPDGTSVYVTGGLKGDGSGLGFGEVYKVTLDGNELQEEGEGDGGTSGVPEWTLLGNEMPVPLAHHKSIILPNGTIILLGGLVTTTNQLSPLTNLYTLDTTSPTSEWKILSLPSPAPPARRGHSLTLTSAATSTSTSGESKAYLFGGVANGLEGGSPLDDVWELTLNENGAIWKAVQVKVGGSGNGAGVGKRAAGDGPGGRWDHAAVGVDGKILIFGGRATSGPADTTLYAFDTSTSTWLSTLPGISTSASQAYNGIPGTAGSSDADGSGSGSGSGTAAGGVGASVTGTGVGGAVGTGTVGGGAGGRVSVSMEVVVTTDGGGKAYTTTIRKTTAATGTSGAGDGDLHDGDVDSAGANKKAIALGTVFGVLGAVALGAAAFVIRKKRNSAGNTKGNFRFMPYGGRPDRSGRRAYPISGEGGQSLIGGNQYDSWLAGEKPSTPSKESAGYTLEGEVFPLQQQPRGSGYGYTASANPYSPGTSGGAILANVVNRIRNVSGKVDRPRFDILADEDRSDIWKREGKDPHGREVSGATTGTWETDGGETVDAEEYRVHHPAVPSGHSTSVSRQGSGNDSPRGMGMGMVIGAGIGMGTPSSGLNTSGTRRRISGKQLPETPVRDPFEDPIETYYDANVMRYADGGNGSDGPDVGSIGSNSLNSKESSLQRSLEGVAFPTATRMDVRSNSGKYTPVKRSESILKRISGAFGSGKPQRQSSIAEDEGFLDPTPPPGLDPITEVSPNPDAGPSAFKGRGVDREMGGISHSRSIASLATAATATSEMLATYENMQVIQRDRSPSSHSRRQTDETEESLLGRRGDEFEADLADVFVADPDELNNLPSTPTRPDSSSAAALLRTTPTPKGPRSAPPRHPTHIDLGRRPVKDIADSINKRNSYNSATHSLSSEMEDFLRTQPTSSAAVDTTLFQPTEVQANASTFASPPPPMHSPYRGVGGPRGPRGGGSGVGNGVGRPGTVYEVGRRGVLVVANPE